MSLFCSHRRNIFRLTVLIIGGILLFNEYLVYFFFSLTWPKVACGNIDKLHSVMLVADPQILGEKSEPFIARWDNDRYLRRSFATALRHVEPELIIFLGDLMDEGSIATDEEYQRYFQRFKDIFQLDYFPANKTVFAPGDNDIGGEDELVTDKKVNRFKQHFSSPTIYNLGRVQFVQVDKMQRVVPLLSPLSPNDNQTRVVISHMPLLGLPSAFAAEVLQKLRPQVILSAHDHKLARFSGDIETGERLTVDTSSDNWLANWQPSWRFQRSDHQTYEVVVPTCSYRMGVSDMGFGVALFDRRGEAWCYHVLWLPSRFHALILYLCVITVMLAAVVVTQCCLRPCRSRHKSALSYRFL
ncbi:metallophosphoesterase 1-like [Homalodisca vitripennis]|uniref:metallophosphoesterase 1-like n=1 Tax=Homalodisca vitripennis TaxID=197043 RepID=UPI001EE9CB26|nr:metallophosphoesterase 1-like [Homalodisca vitripennis]XP_046678000.1 metallophosphoesterase 1-like [Homalodisca vitripennis]XP_046678001.1 metallophosphoesterase 1-like [Homalodisca vitripennis]